MQVDFAKDVIVLGTWAMSLSTFGIWISALLGLVVNLLHNRKIYKQQYKDKRMSEIAEDAFMRLEEISHLTPTKSDDKLFEFLRLSVSAFKKTFGYYPSTGEIARLKQDAERLAKKDKVLKLNKKKLAKEIENNG